MSASVTTRQVGKVAVIDLGGRITLDGGTGTIRDAIKGALESGQKNILLNLGEVTYIDSAGLGELSSAYITVSRLGGKLKLLNPQSKVHGMLQVTRLYTIFVTFADEQAALESFH
ncbi:MAG: STAS domain-containing protein [Candidatus Solibacter sp.]